MRRRLAVQSCVRAFAVEIPADRGTLPDTFRSPAFLVYSTMTVVRSAISRTKAMKVVATLTIPLGLWGLTR